jgi:hypothetical protein
MMATTHEPFDGYDARTLRELLEVVEANEDRIERTWDEFFR